MAQRNTGQPLGVLLDEWHGQAWWQRLLLPGDFMDKVTLEEEEALTCHQTTIEYLTMSDVVEAETMKVKDSKFYSTDLGYRPSEFKNETCDIITDAVSIRCPKCSGSGRITCGRCSGDGRVNCSVTTSCSACNGSGKRSDSCGRCDGSGKVDKPVTRYGRGNFDRTAWTRSSCPSCDGRGRHDSPCASCIGGKVTCNKCGGRGSVNCGQCRTTGKVQCGRCDGEGQLVSANVIYRKFTASAEFTHQLSNLAADQFKNGLAAKHFKSITGDLAFQQFEPPSSGEIVLQRRSVHSYDVLSCRYAYNDKEFYLNRITGGGSTKYATAGLPLSGKKIAITAAVVCALVLALGVLWVLL